MTKQAPAISLGQACGELDDGRREDEIEIELEPGGVPLLARLLRDAQPRRLEPERGSAEHEMAGEDSNLRPTDY
jgi:hypothetical protein